MISFVLYEGSIYTNVEVVTRCSQEIFELDVTDDLRCDAPRDISLEIGLGLAGKKRTISFGLSSNDAQVIRMRKE